MGLVFALTLAVIHFDEQISLRALRDLKCVITDSDLGRHADLSGCRNSDVMSALTHLARVPYVKSIQLSRCIVNHSLQQAISRCSSVTSLRVEHSFYVREPHCSMQARLCSLGIHASLVLGDMSGFDKLQMLDVDSCHISESQLASLISGPQIARVTLRGITLTDRLARSLAGQISISELRLENATIAASLSVVEALFARGYEHLEICGWSRARTCQGELLVSNRQFERIRSLTLRSCEFTSTEVAALIRASRCEKLALSGQPIDDTLGKAISELSRMWLLDVSDCTISLGPAADLKRCNLRTIFLTNCVIRNGALHRLPMSDLMTLSLTRSRLDRASKERLEAGVNADSLDLSDVNLRTEELVAIIENSNVTEVCLCGLRVDHSLVKALINAREIVSVNMIGCKGLTTEHVTLLRECKPVLFVEK